MKCPRCGSDNREGARFCRECGTTFGTVCVSCGAKVEAGGKFCDSCGVPLTSNLEPATPPSRFGSPDIYTPKHLAERILTSKAALEGERKHVTVLFADLKGSMELLADRDPEEARQILDPILGLMIDAVHRYEGTVNQVMGDGVMALFGAPIAHEDHAVRACFAALRIQESVKRHAEEVRQAIHATIEIRIGLNSGEVVVRSIGGDLRMDYTAIGQTTHLAARLEQMASPGSILISQGTLQVTEGFVHVRSIGSTSVKGLDEPIPVYEVLGPGPVRSRLQGATARGLSPLIGRDTELGHLHAALERAAEGHGQIVAVIGEPGVGKSRLFYEFVQSPATYGWSVQYTDAVGYERSAVYQPVVVLLRRYFGVEARDDRVTIQERVSKKLQALGEVATDAIPVVLALLGALPADDPFRTLDPARRREYTLDALKRLFLRESQIRPLLLVFENLHWIDPETEALLDRLVESLQSVRILLLVNYRPEYQHGWGNKSYYVQLRINPLESEDVEQLLRSLLGTDHTLEPPKQLLMRETDGNPFFLEESVRTLIETKVLVGERGAYQMAKPLQTFHVPPTVQAVLAARIDRLPIQEKHLLQAAAVIGKYIPFIFLKEIADLTEEQLRRCITHLQAAEFLYETRLFPELEYSFKHALTLEVAYGSMLQERRRVLHARIVEVVERFHPERLAEQAERLAHHAFHGELWGKAVTYYRQAAAKVIAQSANRAAVTYLEHALQALQHLPSDRKAVESAIDLRVDMRHALIPLGEFAKITEWLQQAEVLARSIDDRVRLGRIASHVSNNFFNTGEPGQAVEAARQALTIASDLGDFGLGVAATFYLGRAQHSLGNYREAVELLTRNIQALHGELVYEACGLAVLPSVQSRSWRAWSLAELGDFTGAVASGTEAIAIAETRKRAHDSIHAYSGIAVPSLIRGDFDKAIPELEQVLSLIRLGDLPVYFPRFASQLGLALVRLGRRREALPLLQEAVERATAMGQMSAHSLRLGALGEAYFLEGQIDEARRLSRQALDVARQYQEGGNEASILRLLAEVTAELHPSDRALAESYYREALMRAEARGMRPLVAHCHLGLGRLYQMTGQPQQAREHLASAMTLYREMEMTYWLEKAQGWASAT